MIAAITFPSTFWFIVAAVGLLLVAARIGESVASYKRRGDIKRERIENLIGQYMEQLHNLELNLSQLRAVREDRIKDKAALIEAQEKTCKEIQHTIAALNRLLD